MKVNLLLGRFQPFTKGHYKCVEAAYKKKGIPTVICMINVKKEKIDKRHPFSSELLTDLYSDLFKGNSIVKDVVTVKSADIVSIGKQLKDLGYEIASWTCGTDRYGDYSRISSKYADQAGLTDDFEMIEVARSDEDISATKARNCLIDGDKDGFMQLIPDGSNKDNIYNVLKNEIDKVYNESIIRRIEWLEMQALESRVRKLERMLHYR